MKVSHRLILPLLLAICASGVGCRSLSQAESTQSALDGTRELIREHIAEPARADQMLAIVDQLDTDLDAYVVTRTGIDEALALKNADYDTSRADMQALYDSRNREYRAVVIKLSEASMALSKLATPEEWEAVGKPKHRILGL